MLGDSVYGLLRLLSKYLTGRNPVLLCVGVPEGHSAREARDNDGKRRAVLPARRMAKGPLGRKNALASTACKTGIGRKPPNRPDRLPKRRSSHAWGPEDLVSEMAGPAFIGQRDYPAWSPIEKGKGRFAHHIGGNGNGTRPAHARTMIPNRGGRGLTAGGNHPHILCRAV